MNEYDNFGEKNSMIFKMIFLCNKTINSYIDFKIITIYSLMHITVNKNIFRTILRKIKINLIEFNLSHIILNGRLKKTKYLNEYNSFWRKKIPLIFKYDFAMQLNIKSSKLDINAMFTVLHVVLS